MTTQIFYHVSTQSNRSGILLDGLLPINREHSNIPRTPAVYLLKTLDEAKDYGFWFSYNKQEPMDIWCVQVSFEAVVCEDTHFDMKDYNSFFTLEAINSHFLEVVDHIQIPSSLKNAPKPKNYKSSVDFPELTP